MAKRELQDFSMRFTDLTDEVNDEIISIIKEKGKVTLNVEEMKYDNYEEDDEDITYEEDNEDITYDESIFVTSYYKDNESHECVITSIDVKYDKFLCREVICLEVYDLICCEVYGLDYMFISLSTKIEIYEMLYSKFYKEEE